MYSLSYRQAIHTRRQMLQSSARLFTECAAASIVPRFVACCKVFPSQGRPPLVQHRTAWCQEMAHPLLNTLTCWWPSPWRILLANPKGGGLTPALSTQWRGSRRREFASSILEGETLRSRSCWQREQELCHLRGTPQLGPMPLLREEPEV